MSEWNSEAAARSAAGLPPGEPAGHAAGEPAGGGQEALREALRRTASRVQPGAWPRRAVLERARRRRARRTVMGVPLVAAVAVGAVLVVGPGGPGHGVRVGPAASADPPGPTAAASASPSVDWPAVRVVRPGQVVLIGRGERMRLDATQRCVDDGQGPVPMWACKSVVDGNQARDSVSDQSGGVGHEAVYTPLYIGSGRPARMTVTVDGHTIVLQVLTLPGRPGYATGYGWGPPPEQLFGDEPDIRVYDADGKLLARFAPPHCTVTWSPDPQGGRRGACRPARR